MEPLPCKSAVAHRCELRKSVSRLRQPSGLSAGSTGNSSISCKRRISISAPFFGPPSAPSTWILEPPFREVDRLGLRGADDAVARDQLFGLGEGAVDHGALVTFELHALAVLARLEPFATEHRALLDQLVHQRAHRRERLLFRHRVRLGVLVGFEHEDEAGAGTAHRRGRWRRVAERQLLFAPALGVFLLVDREVFHLEQGPQFELALAIVARHALGPVDRLGHRLRLDHPEACDELLGLGKGTVGHRELAPRQPNARALRALCEALARRASPRP